MLRVGKDADFRPNDRLQRRVDDLSSNHPARIYKPYLLKIQSVGVSKTGTPLQWSKTAFAGFQYPNAFATGTELGYDRLSFDNNEYPFDFAK